jgi:spermidine/putrescine-binding protein
MFMKNALKVLIIGLIAFALATVTYAYAAANTVPASSAGDGNGAISGYTISNIVYTLDPANPINIQKVTFTLNVAASVAQVSVTGAAPFQSCVITGAGLTATCTFASEPTVLSALSLRVIATQ